MTDPPFILASASPRRAELLQAAGFQFTVEVADVDETPLPDEPADAYVQRLAVAKAVAVAARRPGALVLGADTTVVVDGEILGKPIDGLDARRMVRRLAGRAHLVHTGVALVGDSVAWAGVATTTVWFSSITDDEIDAYVASGEPMDKAGAYGIQGRAARFVTRIEGAYDTVVGLPVALVSAWLRDFSDGSGNVQRTRAAVVASATRGAPKPA